MKGMTRDLKVDATWWTSIIALLTTCVTYPFSEICYVLCLVPPMIHAFELTILTYCARSSRVSARSRSSCWRRILLIKASPFTVLPANVLFTFKERLEVHSECGQLKLDSWP